MTSKPLGLDDLPIDPSFHPASYGQLARLIQVGVAIFSVLGVVGFIGYLSVNWNVSVAKAIKADPKPIYWTPQAYFGHLFGLMPDAFVLLSIAVMVATVFGRSLMSAVDLYKGKERFLAGIVVLVLVVIAGAFLIDRYY
ncbi:MAG: DUF1634 domain-containing protein [Thermoplasmata archaeon]